MKPFFTIFLLSVIISLSAQSGDTDSVSWPDYQICLTAVSYKETENAFKLLAGDNWKQVYDSFLINPARAYYKLLSFKEELNLCRDSDEKREKIRACDLLIKVFPKAL